MGELLEQLSGWKAYVAVGGVLALFIGFVVFVLVSKFYRKVDQGSALIVNTTKAEPTVTFTGAVVKLDLV